MMVAFAAAFDCKQAVKLAVRRRPLMRAWLMAAAEIFRPPHFCEIFAIPPTNLRFKKSVKYSCSGGINCIPVQKRGKGGRCQAELLLVRLRPGGGMEPFFSAGLTNNIKN